MIDFFNFKYRPRLMIRNVARDKKSALEVHFKEHFKVLL
jgi:hypothetical protein